MPGQQEKGKTLPLLARQRMTDVDSFQKLKLLWGNSKFYLPFANVLNAMGH